MTRYLDTRSMPHAVIARPAWFTGEDGPAEPVSDIVLIEAGILPIIEPGPVTAGKIAVGEAFDDRDQLGRAVARHLLADAPPPDMPALRQAAFENAMAYGNRITGKITGAYADAEARSWTVQEAEARAVLAGEALPAGSMLPQLAADKAVSLSSYAAGVVAKADAFRAIAVAAVRLRRGAEGLLAPALDTPAKLEAAVTALREQAHSAADALGIAR